MTGQKKRIVVKVGTSILARSSGSEGNSTLGDLVREVCDLRSRGLEIILVTSGAIGEGARHMSWKERPKEIRRKQAAAAIGQVSLMETYRELFGRHSVLVAQVLLTRSDFEDRRRYLNARNTLLTLLELNVVPVINENDTVAVEEIQFGDNDHLSALVAAKIDADILVILSDVEGLFRHVPGKDNELIPLIPKIDSDVRKLAWKTSSSGMGTGGMASKLEAARIATASGVTTVVASGFKEGALSGIVDGRSVGTKFVPGKALSAKGKWILFGALPKGEIVIDPGAVLALRDMKRSLLPAGVVGVRGFFRKGEVVRIKTADDEEVARGIVSFSSGEVEQIKGLKTGEIKKLLISSPNSTEIIHRDSLVIL